LGKSLLVLSRLGDRMMGYNIFQTKYNTVHP
jgi:hypothetical protein